LLLLVVATLLRIDRILTAGCLIGIKEEGMRMEWANDSLDPVQALVAVGDDRKSLAELAGILGAACPTLLAHVQTAFASGDLSAAVWSEHLLRVATESVAASKVARHGACFGEESAREDGFEAVGVLTG
jgi:hypothetical protein